MSLSEWRKQAAHASGGTSNPDIKKFVLGLVREYFTCGSVLDYGSGNGELLHRLIGLDEQTRRDSAGEKIGAL